MQGQCFANCPFISALASIAWVNRGFILQNANSGTYTFNFCDYGVNNDVTLPNNIALGTMIKVTVSAQVLLDDNGLGNMADANGDFYGAGSYFANEIWPALYERAYAKFCMYENGLALEATPNVPMSAANLTDTTKDPTYADVLNLSTNGIQNYWGGNGAIGLMYLTGLSCYTLNTQTANFPTSTTCGVTGATGTTANEEISSLEAASLSASGNPITSPCSLYSYIQNGFCAENSKVYGLYKTRYPLVAWTYFSANNSPNPGAATGNYIVFNHNYSILGVFDAPNGLHYIILRNTFGSSYPLPNFTGVAAGNWSISSAPYDAEFPMNIGKLVSPNPASVPSSAHTKISLPVISLSPSTPNGIFGLEQGAFINYFTAIGWAQGY
jgi:hypothetical protein